MLWLIGYGKPLWSIGYGEPLWLIGYVKPLWLIGYRIPLIMVYCLLKTVMIDWFDWIFRNWPSWSLKQTSGIKVPSTTTIRKYTLLLLY